MPYHGSAGRQAPDGWWPYRPGHRTLFPDRLGVSPTRSEVASSAEELMTVHRAELDAAAHARVLSTAESELLLARLDLVGDQAIGPG
jgi:hypothetical protein